MRFPGPARQGARPQPRARHGHAEFSILPFLRDGCQFIPGTWVRLVEQRTDLSQPDAESRVSEVVSQAHDAIARARSGAVILAFMIAASLMLGAAVAWLAAAFGGEHRDQGAEHHFWRRWEVNHMFFIR